MNAEQYAAFIRASMARLVALDADRAADVRAELCLGVCLAEAVGRGLVRGVTHAGRGALVFTFGQLSTALDDAAAHRRLTDAAEEDQR
ncbi:hypothetical protein [Micromonospora chersina]|uniref:hypothetical protein n=1 Tax=Micromonospora chersina TaxID=47854 RepID=UPI0037239525